MGSEWNTKELGDCGRWYSGGTPRKSNPDYWSGDIPWISAKSLHDFFVSESEDMVSEAAIGNGTRLIPENSILFVVRGMSLKTEFRLGVTTRPVSFNQDLRAIVPNVDIDVNFLAYAIKSKTHEILGLVEEAGHGTGVLPTSLIKSLDIPIPSKGEQRAIGGFFRSVDDKIELNRRMNETLESMAQALFKSWFVDFDPVIDNALAAGNPLPEPLRARAETRRALGDQRKPLPDEIQKLFPDVFVFHDEMEWVPKGWEVKSVSDAITINPKVTLKKGAIAKYVDMKVLPTSGFAINEVIEKAFSGGSKFLNNDVLMARITPCLENGKAGVVDYLEEGEPGFGSTEFIVFRPQDYIGTPFIAALVRDENFRSHCIANMVGSSGRQRVQNSCFESYLLCLPIDPAVLNAFHESGASFFSRITALKLETNSLTKLRDTLLPKLLSGELRIPDAEKLVANVL